MSEPILVLGMHRSGTSCVAGALAKLGGAAPKTLMQADKSNIRGYFESIPITVFDDEVLASAGSTWDDWRRFDAAWFGSPAAAGFRSRAAALFEAEFGAAAMPIVKDPRICRFAPFWLDVFDDLQAKPRILIPLRSPLEVAQSLSSVHGIPVVKGLLLWLRHTLDAEAQTRHVARSIFTFDQFLADWRGIVEKIAAETGLALPPMAEATSAEIDAFLSDALVHERVDRAELAAHREIHEWTLAAYDGLIESAGDPLSRAGRDRLDEIRGLFERSIALFDPLIRQYDSGLAQSRAEAGAFRGERDLLRAQQARAEREAAALRDDRDRLAAELRAAQETAAASAAAHAAALAEDEAKARAQLRALRDTLVDAEAALARSQSQARSGFSLRRLLPASRRLRRQERRLMASALFDADWYNRQYPDVAASGRSPAAHYLEEGYLRGYQPNPLFDTRWYLERYEDVRRSGMNPLIHYLLHGCHEGRDPGPNFQTRFYLLTYPDVRTSGVNALAHYLRLGKVEGRLGRTP